MCRNFLPRKYDVISQLRHSYAKGPFCVARLRYALIHSNYMFFLFYALWKNIGVENTTLNFENQHWVKNKGEYTHWTQKLSGALTALYHYRIFMRSVNDNEDHIRICLIEATDQIHKKAGHIALLIDVVQPPTRIAMYTSWTLCRKSFKIGS